MNRVRRACVYLFDLLFPVFCLGCKQEGLILCAECESRLVVAPLLTDSVGFLSRHIALAPYVEGELLAKVIHAFKYSGAPVVPVLERFIAQFFSQHAYDFGAFHAIVAVPLHYRRQAERGMNQAAAIAEMLSRQLNTPVLPLLERKRATKQQALLKKEKRKENVLGAFRVRSVEKNFSVQKIILVDDVYTTGSTMQECARVLHESGVQEVVGITLTKA